VTPATARRAAAVVAGLPLLVLLAIANAAGYRYGVADQAFYLPSILHAMDPTLYPRDAALLQAQGSLMVSDELTAFVLSHMPLSIETLFLTAHVASLALLMAAGWAIGRRLGLHPWTAAACCLAMTLRHRITETGANSFEGYYHPRGLAFACGATAAAACAGNRLASAWALVAVATMLHPTTGTWWAIWLAGATVVMRPQWRRQLVGVASAAAILALAALMLTPLKNRLGIMDTAWILPFASKDYVFPTAWPVGAWLGNLVLPAVVAATWRWRNRRGLAAPWEAGMVAGVVLLTAMFVASLPFIAAHRALAVQLQTSRVFWLIDLFAVLSLTWALAEARGARAAMTLPDRPLSWRRPAIVAAVLLAASVARGIFIMTVEHPERRFVQASLEDTDWVRVGRWLATRTEVGTHVLADPDHDWKFGHSVRVTARRDVLVEGVKDAALALYDRGVATRVQARLEALGDFAALDASSARALARRFDLDVLVIDRDVDLEPLHRDGRFRVYRLR
jgi:hypothetical protein